MRYVEDSREGLTAELAALAEGWDHLGRPERAAQADAAATDLATGGADSVTVGHTVYIVVSHHH